MARTARLLTFLAALSVAQFAYAQNPVGHIAGVVNDDQGTAVVGVYVTAHGTDQSQRIQTDAEGQFILHDLVAGRYVLTAARDGYTTVVRSGVMVKVGKTATLPLVMKVAPVSEAPTAANSSTPLLPSVNLLGLLPSSSIVRADQLTSQFRR